MSVQDKASLEEACTSYLTEVFDNKRFLDERTVGAISAGKANEMNAWYLPAVRIALPKLYFALEKLPEVTSEAVVAACLQVAIKREISLKDAGFITGRAIGTEPVGSYEHYPKDFRAGMTLGHIIETKNEGYLHYKKALRYALVGTTATAALMFGLTPGHYDPLKTEQLNLVTNVFSGACLGLLAYGNLAVRLTGLYCRDGNVSEKLYTRGAFALHRNPFHASGLAGLWGFAALRGYAGLLSEPLQLLPFFVAAGTAIAATRSMIAKATCEEHELELQFGKKYLDYKERVPRYIPGLGHLFLWLQRKKSQKKVS